MSFLQAMVMFIILLQIVECFNGTKDFHIHGHGKDQAHVRTNDADKGTFDCRDFSTMLGLFTSERGLVRIIVRL